MKVAHLVHHEVRQNLVNPTDLAGPNGIAVGIGSKQDEPSKVGQEDEDHVRGNIQKNRPIVKYIGYYYANVFKI